MIYLALKLNRKMQLIIGGSMKTKTLSLSTILGFLGLVLMLHMMQVQAAIPSIDCETAFGEKSFKINGNQISFHKQDEKGVFRSISSISSQSIRTEIKNQGFNKILYIDGNKYRISIKNINDFSDVEDYVSITGPNGHQMTYPLTCKSV